MQLVTLAGLAGTFMNRGSADKPKRLAAKHSLMPGSKGMVDHAACHCCGGTHILGKADHAWCSLHCMKGAGLGTKLPAAGRWEHMQSHTEQDATSPFGVQLQTSSKQRISGWLLALAVATSPPVWTPFTSSADCPKAALWTC